MIIGYANRDAASSRTTLDDLFRRAGVRHADALGLIDPPNRANFAAGAPRRLTYAQADHAISALAARLRALGLQTDSVIALQLGNTVESVVALMGVLRAGMIAATLPLLWRKQEVVEALGRVSARAIVTASHIGQTGHAEIAMQAASELFPIRHVCAFGHDLPDGVVPLDDIFAPGQMDFVPPSSRPANAAAHVAVITFDIGTQGIAPVARNHVELIAGGLGPYLESGAALDANILSAISPGSFASIALSVMPWLLGGGTLELHHAFDPEVFAGQCRAQEPYGKGSGSIVLPGAVLGALADAGHLAGPTKTILALWRSPERLAASAPWHGEAALVDVASFGETGLIVGLRGPDGLPSPISYAGISAPRAAVGADMGVEALRTSAGTLALRGPAVPAHAYPPGAEKHRTVDALGFVDTGFACRLERDSQTLVITGPPGGITTIGGYRFRQSDIDAQVADADAQAVIVALPDAFLAQRLAGSAPDRAATAAKLQAVGSNPLIAGAFRPRGTANAA